MNSIERVISCDIDSRKPTACLADERPRVAGGQSLDADASGLS